MLCENLSKVERVEVAISALSRSLNYLQEHDYSSAQVMVSLVRQVLEELQLDFDLQFQSEVMLEQVLERSLK
ncbi:MAG: hypothetical protein Kow00121_63230 [Elainellaceae cyanobacterium]